MRIVGWFVVIAIGVFMVGLSVQVSLFRSVNNRPLAPKVVVATAATATRLPGTVTLRAAPGNTKVQMFDALTGDSDVTVFSAGTECTKLDGPTRIIESGVTMSFYKLRCNGQTGYVNAKWVR